MNAHNNAVDDGAQRVWRTNAGNYYHVLDLVITDPEVTLRARKVIRATFLIFVTLCARTALLIADGKTCQPLMQTLVGIAFVAVSNADEFVLSAHADSCIACNGNIDICVGGYIHGWMHRTGRPKSSQVLERQQHRPAKWNRKMNPSHTGNLKPCTGYKSALQIS
ncbi:hypothetical protein Pmar_PMAR005040 [Perkinsus marinus ATCC 50983]|uniref:Uncharacterized protein n=1 Tax=Perkinsus marinus (strain ATCC 50983 / TXsc) TaxID=423536 RepID=C5KYQ2_PERM5|nr:hypothetical protein Pmar_PMAR005040 [Perkinsus marinus ATCC 50983]EER10391.1 hypothetical protein Pmar_PMAR005040 [Perkinsus marinus ATCC 50983]|eukprot:XP_002778596.1 hypothetical protein Pmar_PMAR005040 [Perkinsus marinus ATCC 50983]